jgi:outer membrane protein TolC
MNAPGRNRSARVFKSVSGLIVSGLLLGACTVTPEQLEDPDIIALAEEDQALIEASEEPLSGPLDLSTAVARSLKYNLNHRVQLMETALANKSFELAKMDMLPILAAEGGYTARSNYDASTSMSVWTHRRTEEPTTSEERDRFDASARFSWNILDFGISYLQAKQEADRYLVTQLSRDKAMQQMVHEVRTAYWRAAALQTVDGDLDRLLAAADRTRADLERVREEALRPPLDVLEDMRALSEIVQQLETMRQSVVAARVDLASLANLPPGSDVALDIPQPLPEMPAPTDDLETLELLSLVGSGDYVSQLYNSRIEQAETRKALLRLLPGAELFAGLNFDSNDFLYNNTWAEVGARVNWNIMRLLSVDEVREHNEGREQLAQARRLATNMAVITRLRLSHQSYSMALGQLTRADDINMIDSEIQTLTRQAEATAAVDGVARLRSEVRALRSRVAYLLAYADAQDAYGQFIVSLGLSPVPDDYQTKSVEELADHIEDSFARWSRNEFPLFEMPPAATRPDETDPQGPAEPQAVSMEYRDDGVNGTRVSPPTAPTS